MPVIKGTKSRCTGYTVILLQSCMSYRGLIIDFPPFSVHSPKRLRSGEQNLVLFCTRRNAKVPQNLAPRNRRKKRPGAGITDG